jgi:hypothetical protein
LFLDAMFALAVLQERIALKGAAKAMDEFLGDRN